MSKVTKRVLARGQKLSASDWAVPTQAVAAALAGEIDPQNLQRPVAPFSILLNFPRLPAYAFAPAPQYDEDEAVVMVPFVLPPLQDQWGTAVGDEMPMPTLKSLSVGLDTGMGNNLVRDTFDSISAGVPLVADSNYVSDYAYLYDLELTIREKDQSFRYGHTATAPDNVPRKIVFQTSISGLAFFQDDVSRSNPLHIEANNVTLNPFKTYVLYISAPNLWTGTPATGNGSISRGMLSNLTIKLNFDGPMLTRDIGGSQNMPSSFDGTELPTTVTLTTPTVDKIISARTINVVSCSGEIQTQAESLDNEFLKTFPSGRNEFGGTPLSGSLSQCAGYSVIAIPLFSGWNDIRSQDINTIGLPYFAQFNPGLTPLTASAPWQGYLFDQRVITIGYPFTVHQVLLANNNYGHELKGVLSSSYPYFQGEPRGAAPPNGLAPGQWHAAIVPTSTTFTTQVGVGICSGLRSDAKEYEQVAYAEWTPSTKTSYLVDRIKAGQTAPEFGRGGRLASGEVSDYDQEIFLIPLVPDVVDGAGTRSYYNQGNPYYIGKSDLNTCDRTVVGIYGSPGTTRTPTTDGCETHIEVRMVMSDVRGLQANSQPGAPPSDPNPTDTCYVGMGGHFLYIIGKVENATTYNQF